MQILLRLTASTAALFVSSSTIVFAGFVVLPPTPVSEPGTLLLMGLGVAAAIYIAKKRK